MKNEKQKALAREARQDVEKLMKDILAKAKGSDDEAKLGIKSCADSLALYDVHTLRNERGKHV